MPFPILHFDIFGLVFLRALLPSLRTLLLPSLQSQVFLRAILLGLGPLADPKEPGIPSQNLNCGNPDPYEEAMDIPLGHSPSLARNECLYSLEDVSFQPVALFPFKPFLGIA